jgi:hypothetical protein
MTPETIIREAQSEGVRLALSPTGTIKANGDSAAVNRWLAVIREHRTESRRWRHGDRRHDRRRRAGNPGMADADRGNRPGYHCRSHRPVPERCGYAGLLHRAGGMSERVDPECSLCGEKDGTLLPCENGHVCQLCLDRGRAGRDQTTRAVRATRIGMQDEATAAMARLHGDTAMADQHLSMAADQSEKAAALWKIDALPEMAHGEAIPKRGMTIKDTLAAPDAVALDASAHRLELLDRLGTDCAAMALDAADSIGAENSLERMLAHQLAAAHKAALQMLDKAMLCQNVTDKTRLLNAASRMMNTYQAGLLTIQRLRSKGEQYITVQHVTVANGGQAIVGINQGGRGGK